MLLEGDEKGGWMIKKRERKKGTSRVASKTIARELLGRLIGKDRDYPQFAFSRMS